MARQPFDWKTFLKPLTDHMLDPKPTKREIEARPPLQDSLVETFRRELDKQSQSQRLTNRQKVVDAERKLMALVRLPSATIENVKKQWKEYKNATDLKDDRDITGSKWNMEMFQSIITINDVHFKNLPSSDLSLDDVTEKIVERVVLTMKALYPIDEPSSECDSRMLLDAILLPLCVEMGLKIKTEQTVTWQTSDEANNKYHVLPSNRYDYVIHLNNKPVAVVEAKRRGGIKFDSFAQLLVQLFLISSEDPDSGYVGVLTDGYRFIFAALEREKIVFFQEDKNRLEISKWDPSASKDLQAIVRKLFGIVNSEVSKRPKASTSDEPSPMTNDVTPGHLAQMIENVTADFSGLMTNNVTAAHPRRTEKIVDNDKLN